MNPDLINKIVDIEINFCDLFSDVITKDYGRLFFNTQNKLSWDSNHAIIQLIDRDLDRIIEDIQKEYKRLSICPRIYNSFQSDGDLVPFLGKRNWSFEGIPDCSFYLHNKIDIPKVSCQLFTIEKYSDELAEVVLSDSDQGEWITNTIRIGLERNNHEVWGIKQNNKLVGFYVHHCRDGITRIDNVFVHFEFRNMGFGHVLIQNMIYHHFKHNPENELYLYSTNPIAKKIYEKHGFVQIDMPGMMWNAYLAE